MNLRDTLLALCALLLSAASARAALTLNVESIVLAPGETGFVEIFFNELPPAANENLVAYSVGLDLIGPPGVTFGPAPLLREPTEHTFVFAPGTPIDDTGSGPTRIRSSAAILTAPENIVDGEGVLRVPITMARDAPPGIRQIVFNLTGGLTEFSDDIGNVIEFVPVNGRIGIPEPSGACLAASVGLLALARRRRPPTAAASMR
jgi:hypothetical protein